MARRKGHSAKSSKKPRSREKESLKEQKKIEEEKLERRREEKKEEEERKKAEINEQKQNLENEYEDVVKRKTELLKKLQNYKEKEQQNIGLELHKYLVETEIYSYEGNKEEERPHSKGTIKFMDGKEYEGEITWGFPHGRGKLDIPGILSYEGDFKEGLITGQGVYRWVHDNSEYEGAVFNGMRHGKGKFRGNNCEYEGDWEYGQRHGKGKLEFSDGSVYMGDFYHGQITGKGVMQYSSGERYEGYWKEGKPNGEGRMQYANADIYYGKWKNGHPHGKGSYLYNSAPGSSKPSLNFYDGEFQEGMRQGYGIFYYSDGSMYEGRWTENMKDGDGLYLAPNGLRFETGFIRDRLCTSNPPFNENDRELNRVPLNIDEIITTTPEDQGRIEDLFAVELNTLHRIFQLFLQVSNNHQTLLHPIRLSRKQFYVCVRNCSPEVISRQYIDKAFTRSQIDSQGLDLRGFAEAITHVAWRLALQSDESLHKRLARWLKSLHCYKLPASVVPSDITVDFLSQVESVYDKLLEQTSKYDPECIGVPIRNIITKLKNCEVIRDSAAVLKQIASHWNQNQENIAKFELLNEDFVEVLFVIVKEEDLEEEKLKSIIYHNVFI
eukprot:gb/GECH01010885.1/.p1 GENE.gb/GECH01010885.1/~~gb/GECH01010885.1/.p1  ORF type:complete len:609 (+),score=128.08 gb/GECH01010885.1/:1-1827(+)